MAPTITLRGVGGKLVKVGPLGYGCMRFSTQDPPTSDEQAFEAIKAAIDGGSNFINSGTFYGPRTDPLHNLKLLNRFFTAHPGYASKTVLSVKGGFSFAGGPDASEAKLRKDMKDIAETLGSVKRMDLYETARVDSSVPIEHTIKLLKALSDEGHFDLIGLSEASADTIRRAAAVAPIAAVEAEYSYWSLDIEKNGVLATCGELGIPIAAYSPLGHGMFSSNFDGASFKTTDYRKQLDRFQAGNIDANWELASKLKAVATKAGITPTQLALAWLLQQDKATVIPLPGSSRPEGVKEALGAVNVTLDPSTVEEVRSIVDNAKVVGGRYHQAHEDLLARDTPALPS